LSPSLSLHVASEEKKKILVIGYPKVSKSDTIRNQTKQTNITVENLYTSKIIQIE